MQVLQLLAEVQQKEALNLQELLHTYGHLTVAYIYLGDGEPTSIKTVDGNMMGIVIANN